MKYVVNIIHILFSGPLLIYVGYAKPVYTILYYILLGLGILICIHMIYHVYKHIVSKTFSNGTIWYLIHMSIIAPLLIWCGIMKTKTPSMIFSLLMAIGCAAFGYHMVRLISKFIR